jgi:predicted membrane-bound mannosyltransferase
LLFVVVFTQFLTNFDGAGSEAAPYGSLENGLRAGFEYWRGEQHTVRGDSRWYYYLAVIPAYEWFVLALSCLGIARVLRRPTQVGQTLLWWGVASFAAHSWAGERMPWLIIHPLLPFVLLAGLGVQVLWDHRSSALKVPVAVVVALGLLWTLNASVRAAYDDRGGQPQELFVQAGQATEEVPEWVDRLYLLDRLMMAEEGRHLTVSIDSDVYWPYGWYLRDFPTGTFAVLDAESTAPDSDVIFVPHWEQAAIGGQLVETYAALPYEHRWWWVPDFVVGPQSWGRWLWDRQPWEGTVDNPSDCPGSLVGEVYIRNSVFLLEETYYAANPAPQAPKPDYGGPCERPDVEALGN